MVSCPATYHDSRSEASVVKTENQQQIAFIFLTGIQSEAPIFAPHNAQRKFIKISRSRQEIVWVDSTPDLAAHFEM
jgi:hypothetical protein